ncbi:hypothetical protein L6452_42484 [Arctium lappa]|uniref:Uncharacterized protein n=1 Tax=Arctium lappa TaxID=4217 RepID=A0ACB8XJL1_ARCLA|nr:hypothetical protein L6452_42484 [Arctium lappa]
MTSAEQLTSVPTSVIIAQCRNNELPNLLYPLYANITLRNNFFRVLLGLEVDGNLEDLISIEVYIPICVPPHHWVLGVLELDEMIMVIYDNLRASMYGQQLQQLLSTFTLQLPKIIKMIGEGRRRYDASKKFKYIFADDAPQQLGRFGDCGVWIYRNLSTFIDDTIPKFVPDATEVVAMSWRRHMAETLYSLAVSGYTSTIVHHESPPSRVMKELDYDEPKYYRLYFKRQNADFLTGLVELTTDEDVANIRQYVEGHTVIEVYNEKVELSTSRLISPEHISSQRGLSKTQASCSRNLTFE